MPRSKGVNLTDVKLSEVWSANVEIDGMLAGVKINGVDVTALRQVPSSRGSIRNVRSMQPTDPDGMRAAWRGSTPIGGTQRSNVPNSSPRKRCTCR